MLCGSEGVSVCVGEEPLCSSTPAAASARVRIASSTSPARALSPPDSSRYKAFGVDPVTLFSGLRVEITVD